MRSYFLHRLAAVLCTVCLVQFAVIDPSLAGPSSAAKPGATDSQASQGATANAPPATISNTNKPWYSWFNKPSVREVLSRFAPSLSFYYWRSIADYESSDFSHSLGFIGGLSYTVMPQLFIETDLWLYRDMGEEYERFVVSNWFFGVTRTFKLAPAGVLYPQFFFRLPTNPDAREYLSYRGALGIDVELRKYNFYKFHKDHAIGGTAGFGFERNIYSYTASENGWPNRIWRVFGYASLKYRYRDFLAFVARVKNNWYWYPDGNRANDLYEVSVGLSVRPVKPLWLSLTAYSTSRTFLYDQTTLNMAIYSPEDTSVIFMMTYVPTIPKTHELAR